MLSYKSQVKTKPQDMRQHQMQEILPHHHYLS